MVEQNTVASETTAPEAVVEETGAVPAAAGVPAVEKEAAEKQPTEEKPDENKSAEKKPDIKISAGAALVIILVVLSIITGFAIFNILTRNLEIIAAPAKTPATASEKGAAAREGAGWIATGRVVQGAAPMEGMSVWCVGYDGSGGAKGTSTGSSTTINYSVRNNILIKSSTINTRSEEFLRQQSPRAPAPQTSGQEIRPN